MAGRGVGRGSRWWEAQQQQNQHEEKNKEHKEHKENKEEESIDVRGHMVLHVTPWCCALRIMTYLDI